MAIETFVDSRFDRCGWHLRVFVPKPNSEVRTEMTTKRSYSAKAARKGKDIGKPGKNFSKIAAKAGKRYGSEAAGKRVAGAILAKQRAKAKGSS